MNLEEQRNATAVDLAKHFEYGFDFYRRVCRYLREAKGAASVEAVAGLAVELMEQIAAAVHDQVLFMELKRRVHTAQ